MESIGKEVTCNYCEWGNVLCDVDCYSQNTCPYPEYERKCCECSRPHRSESLQTIEIADF